LKINSLRNYDGLMTGEMGINALCGALVEFQARAGVGFADD
jgi:hypothetical protein